MNPHLAWLQLSSGSCLKNYLGNIYIYIEQDARLLDCLSFFRIFFSLAKLHRFFSRYRATGLLQSGTQHRSGEGVL